MQQNTSGFGPANSGLFLTGEGTTADGGLLQIGRTDASTTTPQNVELFLAYKDGGTVFTGNNVAISDRIGLDVDPTQFYRVNTCVIRQLGNCTPLTNTVINIKPDQLTQGALLRESDLEDVEDPTITGAANEEIWRKPE